MTQTILTFPFRRTVPLIRVWYKTGNPACPLACRWVASEEAGSGTKPGSAADPQLCRLCA